MADRAPRCGLPEPRRPAAAALAADSAGIRCVGKFRGIVPARSTRTQLQFLKFKDLHMTASMWARRKLRLLSLPVISSGIDNLGLTSFFQIRYVRSSFIRRRGFAWRCGGNE
jgi:hypothetical protein